MKKLNNYFFGEDEIAVSDGLWFYGASIGILIVALFSAAVYLFN